jgi:hypothetical protein
VDDQETPEPQPKHRLDRPGARTPEDREAAFQRYLEISAPYFAKVEAEGDTPWFKSLDERRELFMRRHRPMTPTKEIA